MGFHQSWVEHYKTDSDLSYDMFVHIFKKRFFDLICYNQRFVYVWYLSNAITILCTCILENMKMYCCHCTFRIFVYFKDQTDFKNASNYY